MTYERFENLSHDQWNRLSNERYKINLKVGDVVGTTGERPAIMIKAPEPKGKDPIVRMIWSSWHSPDGQAGIGTVLHDNTARIGKICFVKKWKGGPIFKIKILKICDKINIVEDVTE